MKILYGVVGEGMGHATRSRVVIEHLLARGHAVHIVASGRAQAFLHERFPNVHAIWGYTLAYEANEVRNLRTAAQNLKGMITGWPRNIRQYFNIVTQFHPDAVVSDFETFCWAFAKNHRLPLISVDNIQVVNRCTHPPEITAGYERDFHIAKALVKTKLPGAFHYITCSFFFPEVRKQRTTLVPSVLRPEILAARPEPGDHLLVYQTSTTNDALVEMLRKLAMPCRIYGVRRELREDQVEGNLTFRPFSEKAFIDDLRTSRAVIAGGGFTLLSEAVYLHKPLLSIPVAKQFEQILNARYLQKLGYGRMAPALTPEALSDFLGRIPACQRALASYSQDGNERMKAALDEQLERAAGYYGSWEEDTQG